MKRNIHLKPVSKPAPLATFSFRMSDRHREIFELLGGVHWLRAVLDKAGKELKK